ncbi:MAG: hypothetical protein CVV41_16525 [Candidatus Riflebacteria bacterium HGW-Riflebacteria-1]|jgi:hypothetical protein|nr:MAG: hypothetical protein CVV41_16525 [Candidatus Riflebacteria bacterium HGW-Riflebacteria-1]
MGPGDLYPEPPDINASRVKCQPTPLCVFVGAGGCCDKDANIATKLSQHKAKIPTKAAFDKGFNLGIMFAIS